jgi:predicted metal-dependent hydrolase
MVASLTMKAETGFLEVDGEVVEVRRKPIRHWHLRVVPPDGRLRVSIPLHADGEAVSAWIREKSSWVQKQRSHLRRASADRAWLFGVPYPLRIVSGGSDDAAVLFSEREGILVRGVGNRESAWKLLRAWQGERLARFLESLVPQWQERMQAPSIRWRIRPCKTIWGSCTRAKGRLTFNLYLAERSSELIEYVVVHELAHLFHAHHGPAFWALVARYLPDWQQRRSALRRPLG